VWEILRANVFTWFNLVLGALLVLILIHGSWRDGLFGLVLLVNSAIGVAQELRAKRTLDRLALLTAPHARVVRDGATTRVGIEDVVLDDVVALAPGDQLVVDGEILTSTGLELDESALTGEANPVPRSEGDAVRSGSFAVAGSGLYRATAVGEQAWAVRVERIGRRFARTESDIMGGINAILKVIGVLLVPVGALTVFRNAQHDETSTAVTDTVAALVAMVPEGLVLLSSIAFAVSALALARRHVLVNELSAVEVLARTDVVCVDKTGTLTDREPRFLRFDPVDGAASPSLDPSPSADSSAGLAVPLADGPPPVALEALGAVVRCEPASNSTVRAIAAAVPGPSDWQPLASVPFSSARKWSAADFGPHGCWVLGAPDVLLRAAPADDTVTAQLDALIAEDVRVLLLARAPALAPGTALPGPIEPVGFVVLTEQVRPDASRTVGYLSDQGITLRVISGDDARTAAAIAGAVGVRGDVVDAHGLDEDAVRAAMAHGVVFGRVQPEQKAAMLRALQDEGHTVAMTGDGVNDVIALKQADLGIAMGSGVPAARAVAQVVLLDDAFASVPHLLREGRRVVTNAERVANLFLTKSVWAAVVAVAVAAADLPYPFLPRQVTLAGSLAIGIPAFFLAMDRTGRPYRPGFVRRVLRFSIPAGLVVGAAVLGTHVVATGAGLAVAEARVLTTLVLLMAGLGLVAVLEWPLRGWRLAVVVGMALGGALAFAVPPVRDFFALGVPSLAEFAGVVAVSGAAVAAVAGLTVDVRRERGEQSERAPRE
ncbi:MAG: HAD family hydrolase, partial [Actinobacteria bacterium]|nr:HAD family hydrolase [Actinomycetota bacterium]